MNGPGLLITRPEPGASELADWAARHGFAPVLSPALEAATLRPAIDAEGLAGVILTSAAAARAAPPGPSLRRPPCWCVGEATAQAARAAGFADVRAGPSDAEALARLVLRESPPGARLLHLRGRHGASRLAETCLAGGLRLAEAVVYEMRPAPALAPAAEAALTAGGIALAPVYSPRSGRVLLRLLDGRFDLSGTLALAISPAAAAPLRGAGFAEVAVAPAPTGRAMRAALLARRPGGTRAPGPEPG